MPPVLDSANTFRQETASVLARLRSSFSRALICYGSDGTLKSRDLQRSLGIDTRLSWQISRIVNADDPLELSPHVPSSALVNRVLHAAQKKGSSADSITAAQDAYVAFEQHIQTYAGDRTSFDAIMARLLGGETNAQLELSHRRSIFEGHRYIWGLELDTYTVARILHPSLVTPGAVDCLMLRQKQGLVRLDPHTPIVVDSRVNFYAVPGEEDNTPLDREAFEKYGFPILPAFCSQADLPLTSTTTDGSMDADGWISVNWNADTFGRNGAVTLAFGNVERVSEFDLNPKGQSRYTTYVTFATPTRLAVLDLLVHRPTFGSVMTDVSRWGHAGRQEDVRPNAKARPLPRLPCLENAKFVGAGAEATHLSEVPRHTEMLLYACGKVGLNISEFDVYRLRLEYPLLDTTTKCENVFPDYHPGSFI